METDVDVSLNSVTQCFEDNAAMELELIASQSDLSLKYIISSTKIYLASRVQGKVPVLVHVGL